MMGSLFVLDVIDWGQSLNISTYYHDEHKYVDGRWIVTREHSFREVNPILGKEPKRATVNTYFSLLIPLHIVGAVLLDEPYRTVWLAGGIVVKTACVGHNYRLGVECSF
jgi:hypothetical protein